MDAAAFAQNDNSSQPPPAVSTPQAPPAATPSGSGSEAPAPSGRKKGRAAMPSWDEIVFGARTDDDLA